MNLAVVIRATAACARSSQRYATGTPPWLSAATPLTAPEAAGRLPCRLGVRVLAARPTRRSPLHGAPLCTARTRGVTASHSPRR